MKKTTDLSESLNWYITTIVRVVVFVGFFIGIYEQNWMAIYVCFATFVLTFLPRIIEKKYKILLPGEFQIIMVLFIYAGLFLGGVSGYYERFWWWDSLLHVISGIVLGFVGFLIIYTFYKSKKLNTSPFLGLLFSFSFAMTLGAVWEIFEFGMDSVFDLDMQRARNLEDIYGYCDTRLGVIDTMVDLILDAIGAIIASLSGYFYLKNGEVFLFDKLVKRFEDKNKRFFNSKG